jgi:hypothetical protein
MPLMLSQQLSYLAKSHLQQRSQQAAIIKGLTRNSVLNQSFLLFWPTQPQSLQTITTFPGLHRPQLCAQWWSSSMVLPIAVELKLNPR